MTVVKKKKKKKKRIWQWPSYIWQVATAWVAMWATVEGHSAPPQGIRLGERTLQKRWGNRKALTFNWYLQKKKKNHFGMPGHSVKNCVPLTEGILFLPWALESSSSPYQRTPRSLGKREGEWRCAPSNKDPSQRANQQDPRACKSLTTKGNCILSNEGIETTEATSSKHLPWLPDSVSASFAFSPPQLGISRRKYACRYQGCHNNAKHTAPWLLSRSQGKD